MDKQAEHQDIILRLAVFEERVTGKLDGINSRLDILNHKTSKNSGAIEQLQEQDRNLANLISNQTVQDKALSERQEKRDMREDSMKKRWTDLLFGSLQYFIPILVSTLLLSLLFNGEAIIRFFGITR